MLSTTRRKIIAAIVFVILLGIFLPPQINGARFSKRLAAQLSSALGRQVKIGSVNFRLLPRPGFDLYDFEVLDDPAFSAEPLLMCGEVTADLRLTSLWQGRLEIANLKLLSATDRTPPSLNLVYAGGHWNIESLLIRAEQVPTAPTSKRRAEQRARFPYIAVDAGRINFKTGPEKKPYTLTNTDFSFWLAAENLWHLRLEGHPTRIDMNLSDTGTIRVEGDLKRASDLRQTPVNLQVEWQQAQLGSVSRLSLGHDKGWRGGLRMNAELTGTLTDMHVTSQLEVQDLRRYDINRGGMLQLITHCQGEYDQSSLDFHCNMPLGSGGMKLSGQVSPGDPPNYDLALVVSRVPLSALTAFALHAKSTLPDDLTATGEVDAAFAFHAHEHAPRDWHGTGLTSSFVVSSSVVSKPIPVGAIHFYMGSQESIEAPASPKKARGKAPVQAPAVRDAALVTIEPFSIELVNGSLVQAQGLISSADYHLEVRGSAPLERFLDLGHMSGFPARIQDANGTATMDLRINGLWANFAPPRLTGTARLQNLTAAIPGIKGRLLLAEADAQLTDSSVELNHLSAQFEHSPIALTGSVKRHLNCPAELPCPFQFDLQAVKLDVADVAGLLGLNQRSWNLPFISNSDKLPDFRASGTLSLESLKLADLPLEKFTAHLEAGDHSLLIDHIDAKIAGGSTAGKWIIDWSGAAPRYSGGGTVTGATIEKLELPAEESALLTDWVTGKSSLKYSLQFMGRTGAEMLASATGQTEFQVINGASRSLTLEPAKPLKFQGLQGSFQIDHGNLKFAAGKIRTATRIYDLDGTISMSDNQARLSVGSGAAQWKITGALDKPSVSAVPVAAQAASTHP
ncbi:MAG: AsmA family protein [Acidobacteriia bacterium]|nr:AsmA family protein [Terriglobia bacterium]